MKAGTFAPPDTYISTRKSACPIVPIETDTNIDFYRHGNNPVSIGYCNLYSVCVCVCALSSERKNIHHVFSVSFALTF